MQKFSLLTAILLAATAPSMQANESRIYKCGATYSQLPCPDAQVIQTTDARSKAQKTQTDRAIARDLRLASQLEKDRLKQEKLDLAANTPPKARREKAEKSTTPTPGETLKKPKIFTARVPNKNSVP